MTASGSTIKDESLQDYSDSDSDSDEKTPSGATELFKLLEKIERRFNSGQTPNQFIFETLLKIYEINIDKLSEANKTRLSELKILLQSMKTTPQDSKLIEEVSVKMHLLLNTTDKRTLSSYEDHEEDGEQLKIVITVASRFTAETKQSGDSKESKHTLTKEKSEDIFGYIENQKRSNAFLWGLNLEKALPSEQVDQLIESLKGSGIVYLKLNQDLSEDQAKRLLLNLKTMPRLWILFFSGKKLSNETAADFAKIGVEIRIKQKFQFTSVIDADVGLNIYLTNSLIFHKRWEIEGYIQKIIRLHDPRYNLAFASDYFQNANDLLSRILRLKDLSKDDMETLATFLTSDKPPLPSLKLELTEGSEPKWEPLIRMILTLGTPITKVLIRSRCSNQIVAAVLESLPSNKTIKELEVFSPDNMDAKPYINPIVKALASSTVLERLELSHCHFDAKEMNAIALAIANNPASKITHLNLQGNKCGDDISESFKELLATNKSLRVLNLGDNGLTDKTCTSLCAPLMRQNTTLVKLWIFANQFSNGGLGSLGVMLSSNSTLISLYVNEWGGRSYSDDAIDKFVAHLERNRSLEECSIENNDKSIVQEKVNATIGKRNYVETAIIVFQASRQQHRFHGLSHPLLFHVLSFISPRYVAIPQIKRCTNLIANNITARDEKGELIRQWKKTVSVEMASGQRTQMTIFKPWVVKTNVVEVKSDKEIEKKNGRCVVS